MFLCVASFEATHFLLFKKERKAMKLNRIGTSILVGVLATSILALVGVHLPKVQAIHQQLKKQQKTQINQKQIK